jgi:membrane-associated HD superfamily phosphohydrolase
VDDGQLSECGLTLRDVEVIRETFSSALKGTFHPRIKYPPSGKAVETRK